jgi:hypothetical protein
MAVEQFEKSNGEGTALFVLTHLDSCLNCSGSGLVAAISPLFRIQKLSTCGYWWRYRRSSSSCSLFASGIPFTIYERDNGFEARSQGYGLTLQQASKAIEGLGVFSLERSNFHQTFGSYYRWVIGEWGKWMQSEAQNLKANQYTYRKAIFALCTARTTRWT